MIITIGREHGSNGHDIARALAADLGYTCFDKEIVDTAAENSNFSKEILHSYDEKRVSPYIVPVPHYLGLNESFRLNMQVASAQFDAIRSLADQDNCIFVGRCADYVLKDEVDAMHVYINAPYADRLANCVESLGMKKDEAKRMIAGVDKARDAYHRYFAGYPADDPDHNHFIINSALLEVEGTAQALSAITRVKFGEPGEGPEKKEAAKG